MNSSYFLVFCLEFFLIVFSALDMNDPVWMFFVVLSVSRDFATSVPWWTTSR